MKLAFLLLLLLLTAGLTRGEEPPAAPPTADGNEPGMVGSEDFPFAEEPPLRVFDPLEPVNRGVFWLNDKLYVWLLKPVARGWRVVPQPARESVANFFGNLGTPLRLVNNLLQLKPAGVGTELARFVINSTLGLGGLFDPARRCWDLRRADEDFGQTLGYYGVGSGFYLVLPVLGPSNLRDGVGTAAEFMLDPLAQVLPRDERMVLGVVQGENALSLDKDTYEGIKRDALDSYLFLRDAYAQHREGMIGR